ncbi:MAG: pantoate--beta-alanine ligase [Lysobacterales bacterium]
MRTLAALDELRRTLGGYRAAGERIALVPTMGNLHAGHFALVDRARSLAERVVVSVFVNPTQFGPNEDFARYPRSLDADAAGLLAHGCDLLFVPAAETLYPYGSANTVTVQVPGLSDQLCGASRPGHFTGVATVVTKLFNAVQPDLAIFGQKDYQQLLLVRRLVTDLCLPIEIVMAPTVREADGLALSSRNQYLNPAQRRQAPALYRCLQTMGERVAAGQPPAVVEAAAMAELSAQGFVVDYAALRQAEDLAQPGAGRDQALVGLLAARLGATRLIDNLLF